MNDPDLLHGAPRIAAFLGLKLRQVQTLIAARNLPTFKLGKTVCARKSTLTEFMARKEAEAQAPKPPEGQPS